MLVKNPGIVYNNFNCCYRQFDGIHSIEGGINMSNVSNAELLLKAREEAKATKG